MRRRNGKSFIFSILASICVAGTCLYITGCSDNPEAKAAKEMRNKTAEAVQKSISENDYGSSQEEVMAMLEGNRSRGLTKDTALLASGNIALAQGQQMQSDFGLETLPLRDDVDELEKILRNSERLLIEKERIEKLLESGDKEIAELKQLLDGNDQNEGLNKQLEQANAQMAQLVSQKDLVQTGKDHTQKILNESQSKADDLKRQAELTKGDQRLDLEKQAFAILEQLKDHYTKMQSAENEIAVIDSDIALAQIRVDGLTGSIQDVQQRIEAINTSQARVDLKEQMQEVERGISDNQSRLAQIADKVNTGLVGYREISDKICAVYNEAIAEYTKINSGDAQFTATIRLADSAYYAALTASTLVRVQKTFSERFRTLLDTTDEQFKPIIQGLRAGSNIDASYTKKTFAYFDQSIEAYEKALSTVSSLARNLKPEDTSKIQDVKCSLMKSELLALHSKMQFADLIEDFDVANSSEVALNALIQKGTELGACFNRSEALKVVQNEGLDYLPFLPLNMEVFMEGKKQEFSAWKRLPVAEQEAAVDQNIQQIDELIAQYGQDAATQLEPLKQEMEAAKERGFKEPAPGSTGGVGEPNSIF